MPYEVFARKWRPQQFDEVVGQQHVTDTLKNAIKSNRIAHAYLFVGPRGIGKTSIARIFAKALNCTKGPTVTPCDKCDSCKEIAGGTNLDVLEIDGASNNGVEQVRELRETVKFAPAVGKFKIYIIDEVHMLSIPAFNALLKTLEEPPPHVKFIFATTEPGKILATILSRCQRFDLKRIPVPAIIERLALVAKTEKIKVDEDALLAIARGAEGGLRDAESALDQLVSFRGSGIKENDVLSVFGMVARTTLEDLAGKTLSGDIESVIGLVAELDEEGKDLQRLVIELLGHFRNLLVCLHGGGEKAVPDLTAAQLDVLKKQACLVKPDRLLRMTEILSETEDRMRYALSKRTLLETALIRCARASGVVSLQEILEDMNTLLRAGETAAGVEPPRAREQAPAAVRERPAKYEKKKKEPAPERESESGKKDEAALLTGKWRKIVEDVGKISMAARAPLADASPVSVDGDKVVIGFDPEFAHEVDNFKSGRNRKAVEHVIGALLKRDIVAEFTVAKAGPQPDRRAPDDNEETAGTKKQSKGGTGRGKADKNLARDPTVEKALDMFDGTILDVRE